jgi:hypothetical protein
VNRDFRAGEQLDDIDLNYPGIFLEHGDVLRDADRLECLLSSGYDLRFEADESPGL